MLAIKVILRCLFWMIANPFIDIYCQVAGEYIAREVLREEGEPKPPKAWEHPAGLDIAEEEMDPVQYDMKF